MLQKLKLHISHFKSFITKNFHPLKMVSILVTNCYVIVVLPPMPSGHHLQEGTHHQLPDPSSSGSPLVSFPISCGFSCPSVSSPAGS